MSMLHFLKRVLASKIYVDGDNLDDDNLDDDNLDDDDNCCFDNV